jgi:hypothetical protein
LDHPDLDLETARSPGERLRKKEIRLSPAMVRVRHRLIPDSGALSVHEQLGLLSRALIEEPSEPQM